MNILIVGHDTFENKGCQALIYTTTRMLNNVFKNAYFKVFSWDPEYDAQRFIQSDIQCKFIRHRFNTNEFSLRNRVWMFLNSVLKIRTEKILYAPQYFYDALKWADLVVVSGGDILADYGEAAVKHYFFPIAVAIAIGKPVYIFAQSISRYSDLGLQRFCKGYLDKAALITVRERLSYEYLKEIGVKAPFYQTADPAFTLKACTSEKALEILKKEGISAEGTPLIGFSVSKTATRWGEGSHEKFIKVMAETIEQLAGKYPEGRFIFVPHVTYRNDPDNDDRIIGREIYQKVSCKDKVGLIEGDYTCEESKGIIGLCALFIGARTHATIASVSHQIPTIALAYSTKAYGIMEDALSSRQCVLDVKALTVDGLTSAAQSLLSMKDEVSLQIAERLRKIQSGSLRNGELAKEFFGSFSS
ncbi:MAG: polysaccharide pyruvyl transferase family protein [Nitrospirae bacterium]|nr:polysaccharide pyruvyl transferase family protein [Nitrospirota bacterium]